MLRAWWERIKREWREGTEAKNRARELKAELERRKGELEREIAREREMTTELVRGAYLDGQLSILRALKKGQG